MFLCCEHNRINAFPSTPCDTRRDTTRIRQDSSHLGVASSHSFATNMHDIRGTLLFEINHHRRRTVSSVYCRSHAELLNPGRRIRSHRVRRGICTTHSRTNHHTCHRKHTNKPTIQAHIYIYNIQLNCAPLRVRSHFLN